MRIATKHLGVAFGYSAAIDMKHSVTLGLFASKNREPYYPKYRFNWHFAWEWQGRYSHPALGIVSANWTGRDGRWVFDRW